MNYNKIDKADFQNSVTLNHEIKEAPSPPSIHVVIYLYYWHLAIHNVSSVLPLFLRKASIGCSPTEITISRI